MSDVVACPNPDCGRDMDRLIYVLCSACGTDLWSLPSLAATRVPEEESSGQSLVQVRSEPAGTADGAPLAPVVFRLPNGAAILVPPDGLPVALGRDPDFPDAGAFEGFDNVSRRHATLWFDGETLSVKDNGSSNGTWVDAHRLQPEHRTELLPGQHLRLASDVPLSIDRSAS